jgi:hypothetical protein
MEPGTGHGPSPSQATRNGSEFSIPIDPQRRLGCWIGLDDAEQPEDQDQDQQAAKTDIHCSPPNFLSLPEQPATPAARSKRF